MYIIKSDIPYNIVLKFIRGSNPFLSIFSVYVTWDRQRESDAYLRKYVIAKGCCWMYLNSQTAQDRCCVSLLNSSIILDSNKSVLLCACAFYMFSFRIHKIENEGAVWYSTFKDHFKMNLNNTLYSVWWFHNFTVVEKRD